MFLLLLFVSIVQFRLRILQVLVGIMQVLLGNI